MYGLQMIFAHRRNIIQPNRVAQFNKCVMFGFYGGILIRKIILRSLEK